MKRYFLTLFVFAAVAISAAAHADSWECEKSGDGAECYVTNVRYYTGGAMYVRAQIADPNNNTTCSYVRVSLNNGADDVQSVSAARNVLLTALASGLPVKFYRLSAHGSSTDCYANHVMITRD